MKNNTNKGKLKSKIYLEIDIYENDFEIKSFLEKKINDKFDKAKLFIATFELSQKIGYTNNIEKLNNFLKG